MDFAKLTFDVAYARYDATKFDRLRVWAVNCETGVQTLMYDKQNSTLATAPDQTGLFTPTNLAQWRNETINLSAYIGKTVEVVFEDVGGYGNRLFIDNILIQEINPNVVVLPLELVSFSGKEDKGNIKLNWHTLHERDLSHFIIEKSSDVPDRFKTIGEVTARGNSDTPPNNLGAGQYYSLFDASPSVLNYYRLKMVDNNGLFKFSKTIAFKTVNTAKESITLYPNPADDVLNIVLTNSHFHTATVRLLDITGRVLWVQSINSNTTNTASFVLHTDGFTNGVYTAAVTIDDRTSMHKVVIAK